MQTKQNSLLDILNPYQGILDSVFKKGVFMLLGKCDKYIYQKLSILLALVLVISFISPAKVVSAATKPTFTSSSQNILVGETSTLTIKNKIAGATYTWKSSNSNVATVNNKGSITGKSQGEAIVSCKVSTSKQSYTLKCNIFVKKPATDILIKNKIDYILLGESYDLNRSLKPASSNDIVTWTSSDPSVISPNEMGKFTAKKLGFATITATTLSKKSDSVTIYVVEKKSLKITKSDVKNGKVNIKNLSYGDVIIDNSVGSAQIIFSNVTIGGTLTMEAGAGYKVTTNRSTINKVTVIDEAQLSTFALEDEKESSKETPSLVAGKGTLIVSIDTESNISVKQSNGATIQSFQVATSQDGAIEIQLEGFQGDLVIDSQSEASIKISTTSCQMSSATVKSATQGQMITLSDNNAGTKKASVIQTIHIEANAALTVDVKAEEVKISKDVKEADLVILQNVTKLTNEGDKTSLLINSKVEEISSHGIESSLALGGTAQVQTLSIAGSNSRVELEKGARVANVSSTADQTKITASEGSIIQEVTTYGNESTVTGNGTVKKATVTGNDSQIDTKGTILQVAQGTRNVTVNGVEV